MASKNKKNKARNSFSWNGEEKTGLGEKGKRWRYFTKRMRNDIKKSVKGGE